ncbi:MAG: DUF2065 domain-containing protein [Pseudomonadales bacterium]|nr:DUF2065 domain-containing protein [Pseudomonadales bacterium]
MDLDDLWVALCLVLVLEGLIPFAAPNRWKRLVSAVQDMEVKALSSYWLSIMFLGTGLVYLFNG